MWRVMMKENTKAAFSSAAELGYNLFETDIIKTKDNQVITYHGAQNRLARMINGLELRSAMQQLTYKEVNKLLTPKSGEVSKLDTL